MMHAVEINAEPSLLFDALSTQAGQTSFWTGTRIDWELRPGPRAGETTLIFSHTGWPQDYPPESFAHVNYTWGQIVARLKAFAETGQPQPFFAATAASHR